MVNSEVLSSYHPLNDLGYMFEGMLNYFKGILTKMHEGILEKEESISLDLVNAPNRGSDRMDQGTNEEFCSEGLTFLGHKDQLRHEVESALQRINDGRYG